MELKIKNQNFVILSISLWLSFNGAILIDMLNLKVPFIRQVTGFLFLTFIPGYTILRIIHVHKLSKVESILFTVGLSLFYIMSIGVFINFIYPLLGIYKPITLQYLVLTLNVTFSLLLILAYIRDKHCPKLSSTSMEIWELLKNTKNLLILLTLPLFVTVSSYTMNETLNRIFIIILVLIFLVVGYIRHNKSSTYVFTIWVGAITLLYLYWMFSPQIWGRDIYSEFQFAKYTLQSGYWNTEIKVNTNSIPIITLAIPIMSLLLNLSLTWIFKLVFPFYMSFLPIALYILLEKHILKDNKFAFLATFLFISDWYYKINIITVRQNIAEFYILLLFLSLYHRNLLLSFIFLVGIIFSHYGSASLFLILLLWSLAISFILGLNDIDKKMLKKITPIYIVSTLLWHSYIAGGSLLYQYSLIAHTIVTGIKEMLLTESGVEMVVSTKPATFLGMIYKTLYLIVLSLISIGFVGYNLSKLSIIRKYPYSIFEYFCVSSMGFWGISVAIPFFVKFMSADRTYHFSLIFISMFFPIGLEYIGKIILRITHKSFNKTQKNKRVIFRSGVLILVIFLLFNTGIVYPREVPTGWKELASSGFVSDKARFYCDFRSFPSNIAGAKFLYQKSNNINVLYSDTVGRAILKAYTNSPPSISSLVRPVECGKQYVYPKSSIIFLVSNIRIGGVREWQHGFQQPYMKCSIFSSLISQNDKMVIYTNPSTSIILVS